MWRAAVIGAGAIGCEYADTHPDVGIYTHAGAYVACPDTELVAIADADTTRAAACAARWGGPAAHPDLGAVLDGERPQIVSICTPDATHAALVEQALRADGVRAVLAEKPLALELDQARALTALARERGVVLAVNYMRRFAPAFRALAEADVGAPQHVSGVYVKGLRHNGTHWLDLLRMLAGDPVRVRGWDRVGDGGEDPTLDAELELAGGARARLAGLDTASFAAFELDLIGSTGRVRVVESGHRVERLVVADDERYPGHRVLRQDEVVTSPLRDVLLHAVRDVVGCLEHGGEPACTGEDAVAALALAEAIRASARDGGAPVEVR